MTVNLLTIKEFGGTVHNPSISVAQSVTCLQGFDVQKVLVDASGNVLSTYVLGAIQAVQITDKCSFQTSIVVGDFYAIKNYLENQCCYAGVAIGAKIPFVDLLNPINENFCKNGQINFAEVNLFDLTNYGGAITPINSNSDLIAAFASLGIIVTIVGCDVYLPVDFGGTVASVEIDKVPQNFTCVDFGRITENGFCRITENSIRRVDEAA